MLGWMLGWVSWLIDKVGERLMPLFADMSMSKVRVVKGSAATVTCKLMSYSGTKLTKLEVTATDGTSNKNNVITNSTAREITLKIDKVEKKWTTNCLATINGVTFTSSSLISQYSESV